jgi:hypothetical protein
MRPRLAEAGSLATGAGQAVVGEASISGHAERIER